MFPFLVNKPRRYLISGEQFKGPSFGSTAKTLPFGKAFENGQDSSSAESLPLNHRVNRASLSESGDVAPVENIVQCAVPSARVFMHLVLRGQLR
jgi:hypothetical protein